MIIVVILSIISVLLALCGFYVLLDSIMVLMTTDGMAIVEMFNYSRFVCFDCFIYNQWI